MLRRSTTITQRIVILASAATALLDAALGASDAAHSRHAAAALLSAAPLALSLTSSIYWLSPLNINWIWTCPHLCLRGSEQPTVSFYTPKGPLGAMLDAQ